MGLLYFLLLLLLCNIIIIIPHKWPLKILICFVKKIYFTVKTEMNYLRLCRGKSIYSTK